MGDRDVNQETLSPFFTGSVADAVAKTKASNLLFVVAIHSDDEESKRLDEVTWSNAEIRNLLREETVALRLLGSSQDALNFAAIYPVLKVPLVYILSPNGSPLNLVLGYCSPEDFLIKFAEARRLSQQQQQPQQLQQQQIINQPGPQPSLQQLPVTTTTTSAAPGGLNIEEEKLKLQERLQELRKKKAAEAEQREKEAEKERIRNNKELQNTRERLAAEQEKRDLEARKREKEQDRLAKERIKEQIRLDRLEKEREKALKQSGSAQPTSPAPSLSGSGSSVSARSSDLVFRLFDGKSIKNSFAPSDTLRQAKQWLDANATITVKNYLMMTNFPKHVFTADEFDRTLQQLNLVPNGVIILTLPDEPAFTTPSSSSASAYDVSSTLWNTWSSMKNYVGGWLWTPPAQTPPAQSPSSASPRPQPSKIIPPPQGPTSQDGVYQGPIPTTTVRRTRGNVHQLGSSDDDPNSNRYWNGNSTQQQ